MYSRTESYLPREMDAMVQHLVPRLGMALRLRGGGGDGGVYPLTHAEQKVMPPLFFHRLCKAPRHVRMLTGCRVVRLS